jgi:hypothetical protein
MGKIIIENRSKTLADEDALRLVMRVIDSGRISNNGKQYCYLTTFTYGVTKKKYAVSTDLNKKSDRFVVYDDKHKINKL